MENYNKKNKPEDLEYSKLQTLSEFVFYNVKLTITFKSDMWLLEPKLICCIDYKINYQNVEHCYTLATTVQRKHFQRIWEVHVGARLYGCGHIYTCGSECLMKYIPNHYWNNLVQ